MMHSLSGILETVAILGSLASGCYYLVCLWGASTFLRARKTRRDAVPIQVLPPVSVLKPLKGVDPEIYESFRSHCLQDYPEYEIIFGVSDPNDPAIASVERLKKEFPQMPIHTLVCANRLGPNVKVSNLEQMLQGARYEHIVVNDSDIRVEPDYLKRVIAPLADQRTGMVTCLYRGVAMSTIGSQLESLGISTDFCAGVLVAKQIEGGLHFGLGSTLAFRRGDLNRIGGFKAIVDFLADDYELGRRITDLGLKVALSDVVVETHLPAYRLSEFLQHQIRWARGVRDSRPGGYFGLILTFGLAWVLIGLLATRGSFWAWGILGSIVLLRLAVALVVGKAVLQDKQVLRSLWLLPLRDLIAVGVWMASFFGQTVTWRGDHFLLKKGRLIPIRSLDQ